MKPMESKRIFLSPPHMCGKEIDFVNQAFDSNFIAPLGPMVDSFEKTFSEFVGLRYCLAVSSGTAALHLGLRHLGICPGDEVLVSTLTFIGSVSPVTFLGGIPVFLDSDRETWNMDPVLLEEELEKCARKGRMPKAVVPTDLYGQCCHLPRILEICEKHSIPIVCDCAESMGAFFCKDGMKIAHAGKHAKAAVYSFNGNKIITTSGGGMLASDDEKLIDHARKLAHQARENHIHYEHLEIGYNYRMSNILAAIGMGQLSALSERVKKRREIFQYYFNSLKDLPGVSFMPEALYNKPNRWLTVILIAPEQCGVDKEQIRRALEAADIESRPVWKPMHKQPAFDCSLGERLVSCDSVRKTKNSFSKYPARAVGGNVAEDLFRRGLCLPSGTQMTENDLQRVVEVIRNEFHR